MLSLTNWIKDILEPDLRNYEVGELVPFHCGSTTDCRKIYIGQFKDNHVVIVPAMGDHKYGGTYTMNFDGTWIKATDAGWHIDWNNPR